LIDKNVVLFNLLVMKIFMQSLCGIMVVSVAFLLSCAPNVTLVGWKNPQEKQTVSKIVVWAMFKRLEYQKPYEEASASLLNSKGLKGIEALKLINPSKKYELAELEKIFGDAGADAVLIFNYKGMDQTKDYVEPTTTYYPDYYGSYYNYYSWGYSGYASGYSNNTVTTGGYDITTTVINLTANLYSTSDQKLIWTGQITITDPKYIDLSATAVMKNIYSEWVKEKLVKATK
jgi:hypothetical protein